MHLDAYSIGARGALLLVDALPQWWDAAIVVFPEGILTFNGSGRQWNLWNDNTQTDDVDYLARLIGWLTSGLKVTAGRVFLSGFSNGSAMTQRLAAERPDLVAAAAAIYHSSGFEYAIPGRTGIRYALPNPVQPSKVEPGRAEQAILRETAFDA